jgi:hypothetical protein
MHENGGTGDACNGCAKQPALAQASGELRQTGDTSQRPNVVASLPYADDGFEVALGPQDD